MTGIITPPRVLVTDLVDLLGTRAVQFEQGFFTGSRIICDPAPTDTDRDIALLVRDVSAAAGSLFEYGWCVPDTLQDYDGEYENFVTMRRVDDNIMLFGDPVEFGAVLAATCIAMRKNLLEKSERYELFKTARATWRG